mgnify:CR=1 FL=1
MVLGNELRDKKTHLACDKGNKKGICHFVKVLSALTELGLVHPQLLDIDASRGNSKDCAAAIRASINKLKVNNEDVTHKLHGQGTDSGGGGTVENLYRQLALLGMTAPEDEHLIANCCIHSLQTQLKNAVCATFGEGAIDRINVTQMLHSACRLQESLDMDEWRHVLLLSSQFVLSFDTSVVVHDKDEIEAMTAADRNCNTFLQECNRILLFHSKFKKPIVDPDAAYKGTILAKMLQPILTRWWTVGAGASYVFDCYLVLFHACQTVINVCSSISTPNVVASALFSLMKDQETFIDMQLIRCFNKAYINQHLDWLQSCDDLSGALGFCAHHILVRCHLMDFDLYHTLSGRSMSDYQEAVD